MPMLILLIGLILHQFFYQFLIVETIIFTGFHYQHLDLHNNVVAYNYDGHNNFVE